MAKTAPFPNGLLGARIASRALLPSPAFGLCQEWRGRCAGSFRRRYPMPSRRLLLLACAGLLLSLANSAAAGPNEGGTLILHANPAIGVAGDPLKHCS